MLGYSYLFFLKPGYACSWRPVIPWGSLYLWSSRWDQALGVHRHCRSQPWVRRWKGRLPNDSSRMLTCSLLLGWIAFMISLIVADMSAWCDDPPIHIYLPFSTFTSPLLSQVPSHNPILYKSCSYYACNIYDTCILQRGSIFNMGSE